jgi:hypothetical protein
LNGITKGSLVVEDGDIECPTFFVGDAVINDNGSGIFGCDGTTYAYPFILLLYWCGLRGSCILRSPVSIRSVGGGNTNPSKSVKMAMSWDADVGDMSQQ